VLKKENRHYRDIGQTHMSVDPTPVRIIGGGMTGLTLALRLCRRGVPIVVHEQDPYLGGLTSESTLGGVPVERYYHCILPTDNALLALLEELGLGNQVGWNRTRTGFFNKGRLIELTTTADFIRFPALKAVDRLRLGWTVAYCGLYRRWRRLDKEPIGPFLRRHSGRRVFEAIWEPLLLAKLGPQYDRFAASFIWATVYRMLSARKAKGRSEKLAYIRGRYGKVFFALRQAIESSGGQVLVGSTVQDIALAKNKPNANWIVRVNGVDLPAKALVLCVPAPIAARWLDQILPDSSRALREVQYLGVVCEVLLLRRSLTPYYVLNLTDKSLPFTGVIETSNLTGRDEFGGHALVYLPRFRDQHSDLWSRDDDDIHAETIASLRSIIPDFSQDDILAWRINRARYVQPVHPVGWGDRLPPVQLAPGLAYLSTAQIHPWPVFNDEVVRHVDAQIDAVLATLL
jgi:protoporphyrinogen oxidase